MKSLKITGLLAAVLMLAASSTHAATIYAVNDIGLVKSYTGISSGATPINGGSFASNGTLEATIPAYGEYQGFAGTPDLKVLGVNPGGDVVQWSSVSDWIANATPSTLAADVFADKTNGNGPAGGGGAGTIHGLSYNAATGGYYVTLEGDASIDGDVRQYASLADLLADNGTTSASVYGGNLLNFYYPDEDAPGQPDASDQPGSNYFQVTGSGILEGFQTLPDYIAAPGNANYTQPGFGAGLRSAFAVVPEPSSIVLGLLAVGGCLAMRLRK